MNSNFTVNDQRIMAEAVNYRRLLFSLVAPYVTGNVLEIGAGIGNMTELAIRSKGALLRSYKCVEPDSDCTESLCKTLENAPFETTVVNGKFPEADCGSDSQFDLIFSFNVFEHIQNDEEALVKCRRLLRPGGTLFIFTPAFQHLFGSMDEELCHFRRYSKAGLASRLNAASFDIVSMKYYNASGYAAWFINNKILRIRSQKPGQVAIFDKLILPVQHKVETLLEPPFGQSVYAIARYL